MFADIVHLQMMPLMPLTSVTNCTATDAAGVTTPTVGSANSAWPGGDLCSQSRRTQRSVCGVPAESGLSAPTRH
jgi:hypothetical protein